MISNVLPGFMNAVSIPAAQGGKRADGTDAPTMDYYNPEWARWFNMIKDQTGEYPVFGMRGSSANKLPDSPGVSRAGRSSIAFDPDSSFNTNADVPGNLPLSLRFLR